MKKYLATVLLTCFLMYVGVAVAGAIKSWSNGEVLSSTDLNTNFSHIHTAAEELVTNAKVSSSAAIAHSKLATPALVPKVWVAVNSTCVTNGGNCTMSASSGINYVGTVAASAGYYDVYFNTTRADANYAVLVTAVNTIGAPDKACVVVSVSTTRFSVQCQVGSTGVATDMGFTAVVLDNDN